MAPSRAGKSRAGGAATAGIGVSRRPVGQPLSQRSEQHGSAPTGSDFPQVTFQVGDGPVRELSPSHLRLLEKLAGELILRDPDGSRLAKVTDVDAIAREAAEYAVDTANTWTEHLGGFYDAAGVGTVLSRGGQPISRQAVSKRKGLLALATGSGRVVYPSFQFDGRGLLPGLDAVQRAVPEDVVSRWTLASWLVSAHAELDGQTPAQLLRAGLVQPVLAAARGWAAALAA